MVLPSSTRRLKSRKTASAVREVKVAGGLVGDDDVGVVGQGAGDGDALLLAAGGGRGQLVGVLGHVDFVEQGHRALRPLAQRIAVAEIHRQHDVFEDCQGG